MSGNELRLSCRTAVSGSELWDKYDSLNRSDSDEISCVTASLAGMR